MTLRPTLLIFLALLAPLPQVAAERVSSRQRQAKFDRQFSRQDTVMREALAPALAKAAKSTLSVLVDGKAAVLGTAVHEDGWIVTKASELAADKPVHVEVGGGIRIPAKVHDRLDAYDLALLKIDATGLSPAQWAEAEPASGSFLAAPSPTGSLLAMGVASVPARNLYEIPRGFLGVRLKDADKGGVVIEEAYKGGAADNAGLKSADVIVRVDQLDVGNREKLVEYVTGRRPGDEVTMKIRRGEEEKELKVRLMDRRDFLTQLAGMGDPMMLMSGPLSRHRHGFFNVFQHDLVLQPRECGGPVINLDGDIVGLDIARSGRVESLAIPASDMKTLVSNVTSGKFSLPDATALRDDLKKADVAILKAQEARQRAERALSRAKLLADTLPKADAVVAEEKKAAPPAPAAPPVAQPTPQPAPSTMPVEKPTTAETPVAPESAPQK